MHLYDSASPSKPTRRPIVTVGPAFEPVTLEEAKAQLRLTDDSENSLIESLIQSSRETVEKDTGLVIGQSTVEIKLDCWPCDGYITLPLRPVQSITSITYVDTAGATQTWNSSNYVFDGGRVQPAIFLAYMATLPTFRGDENCITITAVAGYPNAESVPATIKQMVLLLISRDWSDRDGATKRDESMGYERLLARFLRSTYP